MQNGEYNQNQNDYDEQFVDYSQYTNPMQPPQLVEETHIEQPRKRGKFSIIALVVCMVVVIIAMAFVSKLIKENLNNVEDYTIADAETYYMKDRPRYDEMASLIDDLYDKYTNQDLTGEIWKRFDGDNEDYNYVIDYLSELNYYHKNLTTYENQQSSSPNELDYEIDTIISDLSKLEKKFIAKEPLTTTITITKEDGTRVAVAKKTVTSIRYGDNVSAAQEKSILSDALLKKEDWARSFEGSPDSKGTYRTSAAQLAEHFDMYLDYNWTNILDKCIGTNANDTQVVAAYCHATPDVVYINKNATNYDKNIRNIMFVSTIKHEISHHIIATICGTARPPIAGSNYEGVTNSYANIFLGAHEKNEYYVGHSEYHMTEATDAVARAIHDEKRCKK